MISRLALLAFKVLIVPLIRDELIQWLYRLEEDAEARERVAQAKRDYLDASKPHAERAAARRAVADL